MHHPSVHARTAPERPAYIMVDSGEVVTYQQLDERTNRCAHMFRAHGLKRGDAVMLYMENHARFLELCWAAQRSGLYFTPVSSRLTAHEIDYIVSDLKPRMFFTSTKLADVALNVAALQSGDCRVYCVDGPEEGFLDYPWERDLFASDPVTDQSCGVALMYSSGTTGHPKGVKVQLPDSDVTELQPRWRGYQTHMAFSETSVHYVPSPLYHALPLNHAMAAQSFGGTVLVIQHFDAEEALRIIQEYRVTQSSWVATMFIRMLKLPLEVRAKYDTSSMIAMVHSAGPTPIPVKEAMIAWFGPIISESYGSTEGFGSTTIGSLEWLEHKGSVGKPMQGAPHIVDDETGEELPAGEIGTVYFESPRKVEYLNDPSKTRSVYLPNGWATAGDIGYLDKDGYLYLTDRKSDMIISGGVNVYPQEIEATIIMHPTVADVAVFGIPNEDFGEEVKAVVQLSSGFEPGPDLTKEILAYCRERLSAIKIPRSIDYLDALPRHETGKLYKRLLKAPYWNDSK